MNNLLLLDSGAYSVWNVGGVVDLDRYIQFCKDHPGVSYYVSLDVIIGKKGDDRTKRADAVEASCQESWSNYQKMISVLPIEKVIPVFHRGENFKWLEKYLKFGCPYIGFGQIGTGGGEGQGHYLDQIRKFVCGADGRPVVKTHGFAVTAYELMLSFPWHSVDSASWIRAGSYCDVYFPAVKDGEFK